MTAPKTTPTPTAYEALNDLIAAGLRLDAQVQTLGDRVLQIGHRGATDPTGRTRPVAPTGLIAGLLDSCR